MCIYRLGKAFEQLGIYYAGIAPSAKKAGEYLKIGLILNLVGLPGSILMIVAYFKIAESFDQLQKNRIFPKPGNKLILYSMLVSMVGAVSYSITIFYFMFSWDFVGPIILAVISGLILLGAIVINVKGFLELSKDALLIVEREPIMQIPQITYQPQQPAQYSPTAVQYEQAPSSKIEQLTNTNVIYCTECGQQLEKDTRFCPDCGKSLLGSK